MKSEFQVGHKELGSFSAEYAYGRIQSSYSKQKKRGKKFYRRQYSNDHGKKIITKGLLQENFKTVKNQF